MNELKKLVRECRECFPDLFISSHGEKKYKYTSAWGGKNYEWECTKCEKEEKIKKLRLNL